MIRSAKKLKAAKEAEPTTKRAWGYIRVSTQQQANSGLGLDDQRNAITEYAAKMGLELAGIFEDHVSSDVPLRKRAGGMKLCLAVERGDLIIFKRIDRPFRNLMEFVNNADQWKKVDGVAIAILDLSGLLVDNRTNAGNFIMNLMACIAEFEREMIRERTRDALAKSRRLGTRLTPVAREGYWWKIEAGKWAQVEHPETMAQIAKIQEMNLKKGMASRAIYLWCQKEARAGRFLRVISRRQKRKEGEHGFDPARVDIHGRYRLSNKRVPWGYEAILVALRQGRVDAQKVE